MTKKDLIDIIATLKTDFSKDELAYLAITSKVEHPLRDKIAFKLHEKNKNLTVCREYLIRKGQKPPRIDVACIDASNNLKTLMEFKAHSSIDFPSFVLTDLTKDLSKMEDYSKINKLNPEMYFVLFNNVMKSNNIRSNIKLGYADENDNNPVKYFGQVKYHLPNSYKDKVSEIILNWILILKKLKLQLNQTTVVEINAGNYYSTEVSIFAFIYEHLWLVNDNAIKENYDSLYRIDNKGEKLFDNNHRELNLIYQSSELKDISIVDSLSRIRLAKKQQDLIKEIGIDYLKNIQIKCRSCNISNASNLIVGG